MKGVDQADVPCLGWEYFVGRAGGDVGRYG